MRSSFAALFARKLGGMMRTRPARIDWPGGVASFTFDDFPKSALTRGGTILERHGARGTYYTALKLAGTENHLGPMFDHDDLRAAAALGHEIACHTYSHLDCCEAGVPQITAELNDNAVGFAELLGGEPPTSFAYPYGAVSIPAKRAVAKRFASCRGTGQGLNAGQVDMADLLCCQLYDWCFDRGEARRKIDEAVQKGGWLIFYTHDVSDRPSEYGCRPEQLEAVADYAARHMPILPVGEVAARLNAGAI